MLLMEDKRKIEIFSIGDILGASENRIFLVMTKKNVFRQGDDIVRNSSVFKMLSDVILEVIKFSAATNSPVAKSD